VKTVSLIFFINFFGMLKFCVGVIITLVITAVQSAVPQVKLCNYEDYECPTVSAIGMGTLHIGNAVNGLTDATAVNNWIRTAVGEGITLFDLSSIYPVPPFGIPGSTNKLIGDALAQTPTLRSQIQFCYKFGTAGTGPLVDNQAAHIKYAVDVILAQLRTSYLDILMFHFPDSFADPNEIALTLYELQASGLVKHFGASNFYPHQMDTLVNALRRSKPQKSPLIRLVIIPLKFLL
jgi:aryl-alcohol dehydrogenase-like predicted oxidoreductase